MHVILFMLRWVSQLLFIVLIQASYMRGVKAYSDGDWQLCVDEFETSLKQFFEEEQKCRHICEDKLNWETLDTANPEITIIVTSLINFIIYMWNFSNIYYAYVGICFRYVLVSVAM